MNEVIKAWKVGAVRRGLLGTVMIAIGSLTPAYLPQASPIWDVLRALSLAGTVPKWIGTAILVIGLTLLVDAWFRLRSDRQLRHWAVLIIWGLPFLMAPPIFSHDAYSYAAHGWLIHNGISPYDVGPGTLPGTYADQVSWLWRSTPSPYGPLALRISHWLAWLTGFDPYWSAVLMRVPALIGVGLIGWFLPKIAKLRDCDHYQAGWLGILNPIMVVDFIGGAHNDALMVGLIVLAIWVGCHGRWWIVGALIVGVAATIKQPALMTAVALPFLSVPWLSWRFKETAKAFGKVLVALVISIGSFALISVATGFGFGWRNAVNVPGMVVTAAPFTLIGSGIQLVLNAFGLDPSGRAAVQVAQTIGLASAAVVILVLAVLWLGKRPLHFLAWGYLAFAVCSPALHSWYAMWGGVLLPLAKPSEKVIRGAVVLTILTMTFAAINLAVRNEAWALGVAFAGVVIWVLRTHEKHEKKETISV